MYYRPGLKDADFQSAIRVPNDHIPLRSAVRTAPPTYRFTVKRILVPVDGDGAATAVQYVVDSVRAPNTEVHLVNVQRLTMKGDFALDATLHIESRAKRAIGTEILNHARASFDAIGVSCRTSVLFGEPADMIAHYAREQHIDAIIMETKRLHWLKRLFSGAVSAKVTRLADTEVTLVSPAGGHTHLSHAKSGTSRASLAVLMPIPSDQQRE